MVRKSSRIKTNDTSPIRTRNKGVSPPRSPSRHRKSSPTAVKSSSPGRSARKSPSRKSPNRKTPARKSPSRTTKETVEVNPQVPQNSPSRRPAINTNASVRLENLPSKWEIYHQTRSKRIEYSESDITTTQIDLVIDNVNGSESISNDDYSLRHRRLIDDPVLRRSSRLREYTDKLDNSSDIKRSTSKSLSVINKSASKSMDKFSDEDSEDSNVKQKSESVTRKLATPTRSTFNSLQNMSNKWEFGGRIGSLILIFLLPFTLLTILITCKRSCSFDLDFSKQNNIKHWSTLQSFLFILAQYLFQAIMTLVPIFGTKADKMNDTGTKYCFNALFSSIITVNALYLLDYFKIVDKGILLNEYLQLATVSYIFAIILSVYMYIKSKRVDDSKLNSYGNTGYTLYDFFIGREIHPYIKNLDVKILISRISNITALILLLLIFSQGLHIDGNKTISFENYKEVLSKIDFNLTLLVFSMMQIVYVCYFIFGEYKITSTFFWHSEGAGYLQIVSSALYPFYFTTISKHVADSGLTLSNNTLAFASLLFSLGFIVMALSNNIKHQFRTNPLQRRMTNLTSMPTFHGNKLLLANLWGIVRHPNYAGDIAIHIAMAIPGVMTYQYVAASPAIFTVFVLIHRAWRDHCRCRRRYGAAWDRYCKRVPSVFIPKII